MLDLRSFAMGMARYRTFEAKREGAKETTLRVWRAAEIDLAETDGRRKLSGVR